AANRVLRSEIAARAQQLAAAPEGEFALTPEALLLWRGGAVGRLTAGERVSEPGIDVLPAEFLESPQRELVRRRLAAFVRAELRRRLPPLFRLIEAPLEGAARGLAYQLG